MLGRYKNRVMPKPAGSIASPLEARGTFIWILEEHMFLQT